jgi:hypothetical protein
LDERLVLLNSFNGSFVAGNKKIYRATSKVYVNHPSLRKIEVFYNSTSG